MGVMADDVNPTTDVEFSWDEGLSWETRRIASKPIMVDNVIIEPSSISTRFVVYGTYVAPEGEDVAGVLISLDFSTFHERSCVGANRAGHTESDFELWTPFADRERCLLGHKITYTRRKREKKCKIGEQHTRVTTATHCPCVDADYECDYGYKRKLEGGPCLRDETITLDPSAVPSYCPAGSTYSLSNGYRKV